MNAVVHKLVDGRRRALWVIVLVLLVVVVLFVLLRLLVDIPAFVAGERSSLRFDAGYQAHPVPAYVHIIPGTVYLLGAPWQLWRRFRNRHLTVHRRLGRVLLGAGLVTGVFALVIGIWFPYGGLVEAAATVVFGLWFLVALAMAFRAVRRREITAHRRWMIRAFAVGVGIATVRLWLGLFEATGLISIQTDTGSVWFGIAFWLAFLLHAAAAELYVSLRPTAAGRPPRAPTASTPA